MRSVPRGHPVLEEIDSEREDLKIVSLNTDEIRRPRPSTRSSIPTMIVFKGGEVATRLVGARPKARLESELEPVLA